MADRRQLRKALSVLAEGGNAPVAKPLKVRAEQAAQRARLWFLSAEVQGLGIAKQERDNQRLDELVLKVYVERKRPRAACEHPVPKTVRVPGIEEPVRTDVEEVGIIKEQANTDRVRPTPPGFSIGHFDTRYGTLGCLVRRAEKEQLYVLSNAHVLANYGLARQGDRIIQPGPADATGTDGNVIAHLEDSVPFIFSETGHPNLVDAAIARVTSSRIVDPRIRLIGIPRGVSRFLKEGMTVQKTGRTTDYTRGVIKDIDFQLSLQYKRTKTRRSRVGFRGQALCTKFTEEGDSGAAILNLNKQVIGLHLAGSESVSVFSRIGFVIDSLGIKVVTNAGS